MAKADSCERGRRIGWQRPKWDGEAATLCAYDATLHPFMLHSNVAGSCISGDVTPVSAASELEFNSNEATAGSGTDHELLSAEGEDDEDTLSMDPCSSPMRVIRNDLTPESSAITMKLDSCQAASSSCQGPTGSSADLYGLSLQQTKENFYKDMPSSSKNYNNENEVRNKCVKGERSPQWGNLDPLNLQAKEGSSKVARSETLNNGSRRYSDSSAQKCNRNPNPSAAPSRFTTTLVDEDQFRASTSSENCERRADPTEAFLV
ncbi:unnamed protein product, partial [Iphiclides podalirius]